MLGQYQTAIFIGLFTFSLILFVWNIFLQSSLGRIKKNQKVMLSGAKGQDLESIIVNSANRISTIESEIQDLYSITSKVHALSHKGLHKMGILRFNPFREIGGDQSFSMALLDGDNNGVVLSSLYSREGVRIYAKAIQKGNSQKYPLTQEEQFVINKASTEKFNHKQ